jgi:hypothetical protein
MSTREQQDVALELPNLANDTINSRTDLPRRFAAGAAITKQFPLGAVQHESRHSSDPRTHHNSTQADLFQVVRPCRNQLTRKFGLARCNGLVSTFANFRYSPLSAKTCELSHKTQHRSESSSVLSPTAGFGIPLSTEAGAIGLGLTAPDSAGLEWSNGRSSEKQGEVGLIR